MANGKPWGLHWRSMPSFIVTTVAIGLFTDLFLYGIMVPILPFLLRDRLSVPSDQIQSYTSVLLAAYAGPSLLFAIPAGWVTDKIGARQRPFLAGLLLQLLATTAMTFGKTMTVLVIARLLQGLAAPVVWTTGLAMVQETTDPDRIGEAIGVVSIFVPFFLLLFFFILPKAEVNALTSVLKG